MPHDFKPGDQVTCTKPHLTSSPQCSYAQVYTISDGSERDWVYLQEIPGKAFVACAFELHRPAFKPGDQVTCTKPHLTSMQCNSMQLYTVAEGPERDYLYLQEVPGRGFLPSVFELYRPVFKPGDQVICVNNKNAESVFAYPTTIYTVKEVSEPFLYLEKKGFVSDEGGWCMGRFKLHKRAEDTEVEQVVEVPECFPRFNVGDEVQAKETVYGFITKGSFYRVKEVKNGPTGNYVKLAGAEKVRLKWLRSDRFILYQASKTDRVDEPASELQVQYHAAYVSVTIDNEMVCVPVNEIDKLIKDLRDVQNRAMLTS